MTKLEVYAIVMTLAFLYVSLCYYLYVKINGKIVTKIIKSANDLIETNKMLLNEFKIIKK